MSIAAISGIAATLVGPITELLKEIIPDKDLREKTAAKLATLEATQRHENAMSQISVNLADAKSDRWWQAGWRPFMGWTGGAAIFNNYLLMPYVKVLTGTEVVLDIASLYPLIFGLLGLTAARTYEKANGVTQQPTRT